MILTGTFYLVAESERLWIGVNPEAVSLDANNVQSAPLQVRFWAGEGSDKVAMSAYLTFRVESVVGNSVTKLFEDKPASKVSSYDYTIPSDKYATANRISIYAYEDVARTKEIDSKQVNIIAANPTPFPRPEDWNVVNVYKNGEYLKQDNVLYMWTSRVPGNTEISPKEWIEAHQESGLWTPYPYDKLIAAEIALLNFALIGSAVFQDEYMFSQQGVDADGNPTNDYRNFGTTDFTPNLMFDFLRGCGTFSGFIKKVKTVINQDNFYDYFEYVEQWSGYAPYADRLASYVELVWVPVNTMIALPHIFPSRILWPNDLIQDARANIGNIFILLNHSGVDVTVSGCTTSSTTLPFNVTVKNGRVLHAKCTAMVNTSTEYIAWTYIEASALG